MSAVLECKAVGDSKGMVAAAIELWLSPLERAGEPDEVWTALRDTGATGQAVIAALQIVRAGHRIREQAFVDVVHAIADPGLLVELAGLVIDTSWPAEPYLVTSFARLIELDHDGLLWSFVMEHRARLADEVRRWTATSPCWRACRTIGRASSSCSRARRTPAASARADRRPLADILARNDQIVALFAEMMQLPPRHPRGVALYREMMRARPGEPPLLQPIWRRLVRQRLSWLTRIRLTYL